MSDTGETVIYDCNIHVQFLLNPAGPAGRCVRAALAQQTRLILSYYLLDELREMPERPTPRKLGLTADAVEHYIIELLRVSDLITHVPHIFEHPVDRDDSHYVNLAIATRNCHWCQGHRQPRSASAGLDGPRKRVVRRFSPTLSGN